MFIYITLIYLSIEEQTICIGTKEDQCKKIQGMKFIEIKNFKQEDITDDCKLYVYGDASSVKLDGTKLTHNLEIYGISGEDKVEALITLDFPSEDKNQNTLLTKDITVNVASKTIKRYGLHLENTVIKPDGVDVSINNLISDANSLIAFNKIEAINFDLVNVDKTLTKDLTINILSQNSVKSIVQIYNNIKDDLEVHVNNFEFDIVLNEIKKKIIIKKDVASVDVDFKGIKNKVTIIPENSLNIYNLFNYTFELDGGKVIFPEKCNWQKSLSYEGNLEILGGPLFRIIQNTKSEISIGGLDIPASITNKGKDPLNIIATSDNVSITSDISLNTDKDSINSNLKDVIFSVNQIKNIDKSSKLNSNNPLNLYLKLYTEKIEKTDNIKIKILNELFDKIEESNFDEFNLLPGGQLGIHMNVDEYGKITNNLINYKAPIPFDGNNKYNLKINLMFPTPKQTFNFEELKKALNTKISLICSEKDIPNDSWKYTFDYTNSMDFLGLFENITQFTINQVDNKKCVQMSLKSLPEIIPEKYCVGQKCSDGYVKIENKEMCDIKSKVDKGTKKIYLEINDKLDDAIKLSELENLNSEVYINSSSNANVNIDINQLDDQHINKIQISDCTLSIKFKDIKDKEDIIIKIPNIQLTKVTFNDKIENNIKFENNKVILDPKAFQDLSKAKYNNLRIISENKEDITFKDAQTEIGNLVITNDKLTGTLENQLDSGDALTLTLDASVKQFNGFLLESSKSINKLVITFAGNWDKLTDYKNGLIINNLGDIELKDLTSNVNLVLNGKGNVLIGLKGATEITLKNPLTVTQDTNYEVNGVMKFTQIDFVGKSSFTTSIVEESKKVQKTIVDTINVNSATSIKGTLVVNNQMSLKNKSIFISDSIDLTDKMIEFDYSTGEFPKIYTTELMTKPKQILVKYENESKISNDIIGTTQIIYCAPNDKFTLDTCNKYNQTMTFNSNHKELNASSLYGSCNVIFSNQDKKLITCLGVQFPDNPQPSPAGQKSNAGLIVGIIIAFLAVIIIIGVLAVCMRKN